MNTNSVAIKRVNKKKDNYSVTEDYLPKEVKEPSLDEAREENKKPIQTFKYRLDELAKSTFFKKNYHMQELKDFFPNNSYRWSVSRVYPYAFDFEKKGPLYVDEPKTEYEFDDCMLKKKAFVKLKLRYVIWDQHCDLADALKQLGEI